MRCDLLDSGVLQCCRLIRTFWTKFLHLQGGNGVFLRKLVSAYQFTRRHSQEQHRRENLKSHSLVCGYRRFGGILTLKVESLRSSKTLGLAVVGEE
jgi:hypothetical protein